MADLLIISFPAFIGPVLGDEFYVLTGDYLIIEESPFNLIFFFSRELSSNFIFLGAPEGMFTFSFGVPSSKLVIS